MSTLDLQTGEILETCEMPTPTTAQNGFITTNEGSEAKVLLSVGVSSEDAKKAAKEGFEAYKKQQKQ
jgi:hypothetical protein